MKSKSLSILLCTCVGAVILTACGGKKAEEQPAPAPDPAPVVEETQELVEEPVEEVVGETVEEVPEMVEEAATTAKAAEPAEPASPKDILTEYITTRVTENYSRTDIDKITINEDLGTEEEGDYVALAYLTWNVQNKPDMTETMLQMYSDDLAASIAIDHPEVHSMAVFWQVPYLGENTSKWSYERKGEGMYLDDKVLGF